MTGAPETQPRRAHARGLALGGASSLGGRRLASGVAGSRRAEGRGGDLGGGHWEDIGRVELRVGARGKPPRTRPACYRACGFFPHPLRVRAS